ncbi:MAG: 30S ribosomal protein S7 [bacterium]
MPRRREVIQREHSPDIRFNDPQITKFIKLMMHDGKKSIVESIFYDMMDLVEKKTKEDPLKVFKKAMTNVKPVLEVKSRRVGGSTYQVPMEVRYNRRTTLATRWIIGFARKRTGKSMAERLAGEIIDAANNRGAAVKKKEDTHKMAEANKAFAHYKW